ncbi:MAG: NnrU family protein [Paracoccaceae bacterium]
MAWIMLVVGLALWSAVHLWKRVAPDHRASLGANGRAIAAVLLLVSLLLMIFGYRGADFIALWSPPGFMIHINNLLMVLGLYVYLSTMAAPNLWIARIKHPQLTGFKIWTVAHLLVNGDLASVLLFGGLLAWAVVNLIKINKQDGPPVRSQTAPIKSEIVMLAVGLAGFVAVAALHMAAGKWPFPG